ncbi:MAG: Asp-tRNA(Asn)/Glu-tRNA(Gln) amidotransferase subunit GatB [Phycisphaerales bacterium]|nr:Asp-tRNA(Asn)/Glu-tRNA(Gln) amidotransferase subunit GatB [Phycisphaerales bacterium]
MSTPSIQSIKLMVGMEIHIELATRTKMFTRAPSPATSEFDHAEPNSHIDPVVLGLPGALPVMNKAAVELAIMVGLALDCQIAPLSRWDRKGYFYPDLPKGYQISQYDLPLCFDGAIDLPATDDKGFFDFTNPTSRIGIIRAHLEEDAGKLLHEAPGGHAIDFSIADYNRAGAALLEIVTQPDFTSADQAVAFAKLLRNTCRFIGATEGVMQKGHMRFEPNINCHIILTDGKLIKTPIVEVKNLNSFKALKSAIEYELAEQPSRWQHDRREMGRGMKITRGWDDAKNITYIQREKEDVHDYRYFPDPDLLPVQVSAEWKSHIQSRIPELPLPRLRRYVEQYNLAIKEATTLIEERDTSHFYEQSIAAMIRPPDALEPIRAGRLAANLLLQNGLKRANERNIPLHHLGIHPDELAQLAKLREQGKLSAAGLDELFGELCPVSSSPSPVSSPSPLSAPSAYSLPSAPSELSVTSAFSSSSSPRPPQNIHDLAQSCGLLIIRDDAQLQKWIDQVLAANPQVVEQIRAGKTQAIGRLVGETMKLAGNTTDAKAARELIEKRIG